MKNLLIRLIGLLLSVLCAVAQPQFGNGVIYPAVTYSQLPSAAAATNRSFDVTDCLTSTCAAGGGTILARVRSNGAAWVVVGGGSGGDVVGPASATDLAVAIYDGITGKIVKNSVVTISSGGNISTAGTGSFGVGSASAGAIELYQGTILTPAANSILWSAPAVVTAYNVVMPGSAATGVWLSTAVSTVETITHVGINGSGNRIASIDTGTADGCAQVASGKITSSGSACGGGTAFAAGVGHYAPFGYGYASTAYTAAANAVLMVEFTAPMTMSLQKIFGYQESGAANMAFAIYDSAGNFIAKTAERSGANDFAVAFASAQTLTGASTYYLAFSTDNNTAISSVITNSSVSFLNYDSGSPRRFTCNTGATWLAGVVTFPVTCVARTLANGVLPWVALSK